MNTIATSAVASYIAGPIRSHPATAAHPSPAAIQAAQAAAAVHGYTTAFWWTAAIFAAGGITCGAILRWGPLTRQAQAGQPGSQAGHQVLPATPHASG